MFVTKPPTRTSTAAIIESLRQDNALRLDLIKNMKNGLSSIANGVLNQDYDFCNALDWLKESLEQTGQDAATVHKEELKQLIKDGIKAARETVRTTKATFDQDMHEIRKSNTADRSLHKATQKRLEMRYAVLKSTGDILELQHAESDPAMQSTWQTLVTGHVESLKLWVQDCEDASEQQKQAIVVAMNRREKCVASFEATEQRATSVISMLQRIARALDMEQESWNGTFN